MRQERRLSGNSSVWREEYRSGVVCSPSAARYGNLGGQNAAGYRICPLFGQKTGFVEDFALERLAEGLEIHVHCG